MDNQQQVKRLMTRYQTLKTKRQGRLTEWQDIARVLLPRSSRYLSGNDDKRDKSADYNRIYDNTGSRAHNILASGLLAGASSPARQWFRLMPPDAALMDFQPVKVWLSDVEKLMMAVFARSNTYKAMHKMYSELGAFGTAATMVMDDFENVIHHRPLTTGEYCIANDDKGRVCTIYREYTSTVSECVKRFGIKNVSESVRSRHMSGALDEDVKILHVVEPRADRNPEAKDNKNMPWASFYIEVGGAHLLSESGFQDFPAIVPRWDVTADDCYGVGQGLMVLGDIKQLQHQQLAKARGIDLMVNPPLMAPTGIQHGLNNFPGGITYHNDMNPNGGIRPLYQGGMDLNHLSMDMEQVRQRIKQGFFEDLFLMLANDTRSGITATEVAERHEEKLLMLGPVLENIHGEMLSPLIDLTFNRLARAGALPPPPEELQGQNLTPEFVSVLAQAQRMVATSGVQSLLSVVAQVAQISPSVVDKIDGDKIIDVFGDALGTDPRIILPNDVVAKLRQERAEAAKAAQQQQEMAMAVQSAQALGNTPTDGNNALTDVMSTLQGYGTA